MKDHSYPVYRGLQKPLVFKSFRGIYIYWGLGTILVALLLGMLLFALVNLPAGLVTMTIILSAGLGYTAYRQKTGPRPREKGYLLIPNQPLHDLP